MENYFTSLAICPLFAGLAESELPELLRALDARLRRYPQGERIFTAGEPAVQLGVVLTGKVYEITEVVFGGTEATAVFQPGDLFCETYCCARTKSLPVSYAAPVAVNVMLIDCEKLVSHGDLRLIRNLLDVAARSGVTGADRALHLSRKNTREKLLSYLSAQARAAASREFNIPLDRQHLANYLCLDRSAMCAELSRMRDDGLITYRKSRFTLHI